MSKDNTFFIEKGVLIPALLVLFLASAACAPRQEGMVRDLEVLPQSSAYYIPELSREVMPPGKQEELYQDFREMHFRPWFRSEPKFDAASVFWGFDFIRGRDVYAENYLPVTHEWLGKMYRNSDISGYPSRHDRAVTVDNVDMRVLPSRSPVFLKPGAPGEGFPFDYMQNSLVPAGTPVLITHQTRDAEWALVETEYAAGWVQWSGLALVHRDLVQSFKSSPLMGFAQDQVPVLTAQGGFVFNGRVGMVLPQDPLGCSEKGQGLLVPVRDKYGYARLVPGKTLQGVLQKIPMRPTGDNFAGLMDSMLGRPYGWGGMYENRDCSSLLQDLYRMFGIFLPRNSAQQRDFREPSSLEGLQREEKLQIIQDKGRPLLSILYMPGHVMLYLGEDPQNGHPVVYHSMWGLRTSRAWQLADGRHIIGRTVITSLEPGREMHNLAKPRGLLINRVTHMTTVVDRPN
ncbi:SH3 domain-containing C40 family peptidase [Desulfonatronospira sp.]|uniref:SH3 domain-containing C40 family peptidase n=1 Tax=Desulfonatronospira sp. TaxID=1962951 RepID=UPI0025BE88AE|nr:SH3 domain-containing C40 family peptidase [Desulfonatronospira sp.]